LADRLVGALVALLLAIILAPFIDFIILPQWHMRLLFAILIGGGGLLFLLTLHRGVRSYLREIIELFRSGRKGLWVAVIASISTNLFFAFGIYLTSIGVHLQISFLQVLFIISAAMLFVILPVSFAGISPVEAASLGVLLSLGVPMEHAVVFVLILYGARLMAAFEGGSWEIYEGGEYLSRRLVGRPRND
jgi:uncharacterized membrane protein YbhN (UPF0104 family)